MSWLSYFWVYSCVNMQQCKWLKLTKDIYLSTVMRYNFNIYFTLVFPFLLHILHNISEASAIFNVCLAALVIYYFSAYNFS